MKYAPDCKSGHRPYSYIDGRHTMLTIKRAGITDFRFHDLRHTFASHLVMAGYDLLTVSRLMWHKCIRMTQRYAHLSPDHMKRAVEVLGMKLDPKFDPNSPQKKIYKSFTFS